MPIVYLRDDTSRFLSITLSGAFDMGEMTEVIHRQRNDGTAGYAVLVDTRGLIVPATIRELPQVVQMDIQENKVRGPVAIVARDSGVYAMSCAYATMMGSRHPVQVFIDIDDALSWLQSKGCCRRPAIRYAG